MSNFDRILTSVPLNKTAALVSGGKGEHWESTRQFDAVWQDTPLPVAALPPGAAFNALKPGFRSGRLTVIGYAGKRAGGAAYVVRCQCGLYGHRKAKSLRNAQHAMCDPCDYLEQLKAGTVPAEKLDAQIAARKAATA